MKPRGVWIGADPGGKGNFGIAILASDGHAETRCLGSADEAIEWLTKKELGVPAGVGVDAPLWWSSGRSGDRRADQWLRGRFKLSGGQVQCANSLRGAALVQGVMFVQRVRERWPRVLVTETHPKAVLKALRIPDGKRFNKQFAVRLGIQNPKALDHERDAVISAVAVREGAEGRWPLDLSQDRYPAEQDPSTYWLAPVHYFWPNVSTKP